MNESVAHDDGVQKPFSFTVSSGEPSLVRLAGELDLNCAPALATALEPLTRRGGTIRIDVADLTFMDSTGINVLCAAARNVDGRGRVIVLYPSPPVRRVIEVTGLAELFAINGKPTTTLLAE